MTTKAEIEKDESIILEEEEELDFGQFQKVKKRSKSKRTAKKVETIEEFLARGGKIKTEFQKPNDVPKGYFC